MQRFSILTRLVMLSAALLLVLVASNLFLTSRISHNVSTLAEEAELISAITTANAAGKAFGDLKYWLTDLAVSLLMLSESNAEAARLALDAKLDVLEPLDARAIARIREEVDALVDQALLAVDAYTDDERVLGNSLMARARSHIRVVDEELALLVDGLEARARDNSDQALLAAGEAVELSYAVIAFAGLFALLFTAWVMRSIRGPLGRLVGAMRAITDGKLETVIPPPGHDEIGAMTRTLSMFRDSLIERNRLAAERAEAEDKLRQAQTQLIEAI